MKTHLLVAHIVLALAILASGLFVSTPNTAHAEGTPYPVIDRFEPSNPRPGQFVTIYGHDFLGVGFDDTADLQIWFALPNSGVYWLSALSTNVEWDQDTIQLIIPTNLPPGVNLKVTILRGSYTSVATPFTLRLNYGYFLPLIIH